MRPHKRHFPLAALLGVAVVMIPAIATSATDPTVSGLETDMWSPAETAVTPGGEVTFQNSSGVVPHGIVWKSGPNTPACSGVPVNKGETSWKGGCTFSQAGIYTYYCFVHGMRMAGTVYVNADGTVPPVTTPTGTTPTSTTPTTTTPPPVTTTPTSPSRPPTTSTSTAGAPTPSGSSPIGVGGPIYREAGREANVPGAHVNSLVGRSVRLASTQRGAGVHGSVQVSEPGSRLEVELAVTTAQITRTSRAAVTSAGRLLKSRLSQGRASFTVKLTSKAKRALMRRGRLKLTAEILLTSPTGEKLSRVVSVSLRR
jgi:plastocyanin